MDLFTATFAQADFPAPMHAITLYHYLLVSAVMFCLGLIGFVTRRNLIIMFLCTEMMFQAAGIAMIAFGRFYLDYTGQVFVIFVLTVAAAESAIGLAILVVMFRNRQTINADDLDSMKG